MKTTEPNTTIDELKKQIQSLEGLLDSHHRINGKLRRQLTEDKNKLKRNIRASNEMTARPYFDKIDELFDEIVRDDSLPNKLRGNLLRKHAVNSIEAALSTAKKTENSLYVI